MPDQREERPPLRSISRDPLPRSLALLAPRNVGPDANPLSSTLALGFESGNGSSSCSYVSADNVLKLDTWQHVAEAVDRTAGTATLYQNGVAVAGTGCVSSSRGGRAG